MPAQHFDLTFNGYWREPNIAGIPPKCGVFCAYVCTFNPTEKTVGLIELIYIGESDNANSAVATHALWPKWAAKKRDEAQQICFNFAPVSPEHKQRVAAALAVFYKPATNDELKDEFRFGDTTISVTGRTALMQATITVSKKA